MADSGSLGGSCFAAEIVPVIKILDLEGTRRDDLVQLVAFEC